MTWRGSRRDAVVGVVGLAALAVADLGVKTVVGRPRPPVAWHAVVAHGASFPSGHVTLSAGTVLLLAWLARGVGGRAMRRCAVAVAAVFLLAVGASRVVLGVHYPDDVVAGWAIAVLVVSVVALLDVAVGRNETQVNG